MSRLSRSGRTIPTRRVRNKTMANDVLIKTRKIEGWLKGAAGDRVFESAPAGFSRRRAIQLVVGFIKDSKRLAQCTEQSILHSVSQASGLGLMINGVLGEGYLVPYGGECTFQIGYKGIIALARRYQDLIITTRCVYKGDYFDYDMGDEEYIRHKRGEQEDFPDEAITHVYMIARRAADNQIIYRSVWTRGQINTHAKRFSKAFDKADSPWRQHWSAMARKTLIREAFNRGELPISTELQMHMMNEELIDQRIEQPETGPDYLGTSATSATNRVADMLGHREVIDVDTHSPDPEVEPEPEPAKEPEPEAEPAKPKRTRKPRKKAVKKEEPTPQPTQEEEDPPFEEQADNLF